MQPLNVKRDVEGRVEHGLAAKLYLIEKHLRKHSLLAGSLAAQIGSQSLARRAERDAERNPHFLADFLYRKIKQEADRCFMSSSWPLHSSSPLSPTISI